jgi:cysteinyl-tRNA synthetase
MSKSLNNLYTLEDLKNKGYDPLVYRMFNFSSHYRNKINFTWDALESAKISLNRLKEGYLKHAEGIEDIEDSLIKVYENRFLEAINDDLNMPVALSIVWEIIKNPVKSKKLKDLLIKFDNILGFNLNDYTGVEENDYSDEIIELINLRNKARENKNWVESDRIRDVLIEKGYKVKDGKDGTILEK